jgi:hypothetical protein
MHIENGIRNRHRNMIPARNEGIMTNEDKETILIDMGIAQETIDLMTGICGINEDTYNDMLYYISGYRSFEQLADDLEY